MPFATFISHANNSQYTNTIVLVGYTLDEIHKGIRANYELLSVPILIMSAQWEILNPIFHVEMVFGIWVVPAPDYILVSISTT